LLTLEGGVPPLYLLSAQGQLPVAGRNHALEVAFLFAQFLYQLVARVLRKMVEAAQMDVVFWPDVHNKLKISILP
jgi:hypothetical protein